jgi:predicted acylesterase/phospholipase RssA
VNLEPMFRAIAASAAFPFVFAPVSLHIGGREVPAVDGGAVNNAPLLQAVAGAGEVDRIFVITPFPSVFDGPVPLHGLAYASHLADVLIEERMFRDLRDAAHQTRALARLAALSLESHTHHAVLEALGWTRRRPLEIIEVRPPKALEGDAFSGFFSRALREEYILEGRAAARSVIETIVRERRATP